MKKHVYIRWFLILNLLCVAFFSGELFLSTANGKNEEIHLVTYSMTPSKEIQKLISERYRELQGIDLKISRFNDVVYADRITKFIVNEEEENVVIELRMYDMEQVFYGMNLLKKFFTPLNEYISSSEKLKNIDEKHLNFMKDQENIYGFPLHSGKGMVTYIRKDWLDNLNLKIPTNWEEFYATLKAFTYNDPDGNKINDTFGCTLTDVLYYENLPEFMQGATPEFKKENEVIVDGFVQKDFLQALERLKKAQEDGVFINKAPIKIGNPAKGNFREGKTGVFCSYDFHAGDISMTNEKAEVVPIKCLDDSVYWKNSNSFFAISKNCSDPRMIFEKFIEFMNDGGEGEHLFTYGIENVNYKIENGKYKRILGKAMMFKLSAHPLLKRENLLEQHENVKKACEFTDGNFQYKFLPFAGSKTWRENWSNIRELKRKTVEKIIFGNQETEAALADYAIEVKRLGMERILREFNDK